MCRERGDDRPVAADDVADEPGERPGGTHGDVGRSPRGDHDAVAGVGDGAHGVECACGEQSVAVEQGAVEIERDQMR